MLNIPTKIHYPYRTFFKRRGGCPCQYFDTTYTPFLPYSINLSPNVSIGEAFEHKLFGRKLQITRLKKQIIIKFKISMTKKLPVDGSVYNGFVFF